MSSSFLASMFGRRFDCRSTAAREASGADLSRTAIEVLLERTTADFPYRAGDDIGVPQARSPLDAVDPERGSPGE